MTTWGNSENGYWKLGYRLDNVLDTPEYCDIDFKLYIWTKYSTYDQHNNLKISGDFTYNGRAPLSTTSNHAWTTDNIRLLVHQQKRFYKDYNGFIVDIDAVMTGIEYTNISFRERVVGSKWIAPRPYHTPAAPTNMTADRITDSKWNLRWINTDPMNAGAPYQGLDVNYNLSQLGTNGDYHMDRVFSLINSYTWHGGVPDRKYVFNVNAFNDDADPSESSKAYTKEVWTTPAVCGNLTVNGIYVTGNGDFTQYADISWNYPSRNYQSVTRYMVQWRGPTTGTQYTTDRSFRITGLKPSSSYDLSVWAQNPGDGSSMLTGPAYTITFNTIPLPTSPQNFVVSSPRVTGTSEPHTLSVDVSWNAYQSAEDVLYTVRNGTSVVMTTNLTKVTLNGLIPGMGYEFNVIASNYVGDSLPSRTYGIRMPDVPGAPTIKKFEPIPTGLHVIIGSGIDGGSPIIRYEYRILVGSNVVVPWTIAPGMDFNVSVPSNSIYNIQIRSVNAIGTGTQYATASSDAAGGRVLVFDGNNWVPQYVHAGASGIALVRVFDGTTWNLTPQ